MRTSVKILSSLLVGAAIASSVYAEDVKQSGPIPFEVYDINKDGSISKDEFNKTIEQKIQALKEQKQKNNKKDKKRLSFEDIDQDKDGKISKVELLEVQLKSLQNNKKSCRGCK